MSYQSPKLDAQGIDALRTLMKKVVEDGKTPAVFVGATDAAAPLFLDCAGDKVYGSPDDGKVDLSTTVQLYSGTKLVTTVACLQLVEKGLLSLDDPCIVSKHLPELADLQILKGFADDGAELVEEQDPKGAITLRMLLSHTAGLAFPGWDPALKWFMSRSRNPMKLYSGNATMDDCIFPLIYQPGTNWHYSVGLDFAGFLLERITGESLAEYFRKNIFEPCGMTSTSFYPTSEIKEKLVRLTYYDADMKPVAFENSFTGGPISREEDPDKVGPLLMGGAGLFTTAKDYLSFLRGILASSARLQTSESTTKPLLSDASFEELFKDVLSPDGKKSLIKMMKGQTYHDSDLLLDESGGLVGHSVGLCLNLKDSKYGRKAGSGCWDGAAKTQYWIDPVTGVAGVCFTNIFSGNPNPFLQFYNDYETALYKALEAGKQ